LRVGRHFRFSFDCKIIVGRDKHENEIILSIAGDDDCTMHVPGHGSPVTFVTCNPTEEALTTAASLCARYSSARHLSEVDVSVLKKGQKLVIKVKPADDYVIDKYRIVQNKDQKILT